MHAARRGFCSRRAAAFLQRRFDRSPTRQSCRRTSLRHNIFCNSCQIYRITGELPALSDSGTPFVVKLNTADNFRFGIRKNTSVMTCIPMPSITQCAAQKKKPNQTSFEPSFGGGCRAECWSGSGRRLTTPSVNLEFDSTRGPLRNSSFNSVDTP